MTIAPRVKYLSEYAPAPFLVDQVDLKFDIDEALTRVHARIVMHRNEDLQGKHTLVLDGCAALISLALDGNRITAGRYELGEETLTIFDVPESFILDIETEVDPVSNTSLMGLYASNGNLFTQCEPEGFRKITYYPDRPDVMAKFTTTIIADKQKFPVLLSNGNKVGEGQFDKKRHWVKWVDPYRKPCYLFALVAGRLSVLKDTYTTMSGRDVVLEVWTEPADQDKVRHALDSLKRAMHWDEAQFGLEYDLDIYMIVAVGDFNMGAMENKGLNIFNTRYVLARQDTATDSDFEAVEGVIGHEYFHNWTGNRVTCRDWFQLSLKEGLTVFRDQEFSADMSSRAVQRIKDVINLRTLQFPEDAGATAHPVRPEAYIEINNFYTTTVYEKGAEVVRMIRTIVGELGFRRGMELYFKRHDGQAVTCEDFYKAMADANHVDLEQFALWYRQVGTPLLEVKGEYDAIARTFTLTVRQSCPAVPGQKGTRSPILHIPFAVGLVGEDGQDLPLTLPDERVTGARSCVLHVRQAEQVFVFTEVACKPVPSLLRGFSAPVNLNYDWNDSELTFLMAHDSDPFCRWEAGQTLVKRLFLQWLNETNLKTQPLASATEVKIAPMLESEIVVPDTLIQAYRAVLKDPKADPAFKALMLTLPAQSDIFELMNEAEPERIHAIYNLALNTLAQELRAEWRDVFELNQTRAYRSADAGRRTLKNRALMMLCRLDDAWAAEAAREHFLTADNMTDQMGALLALRDRDSDARTDCLLDFAARWEKEALVMDKYFMLIGSSQIPCALDHVKTALEHPAFSLRNPNKVRALIGSFSRNMLHFHAADGSGYRFIADQVLAIDEMNAQLASRLVSAFNRWTKLEPRRRALMKSEMERLMAARLSKDVYEIVSKNLT